MTGIPAAKPRFAAGDPLRFLAVAAVVALHLVPDPAIYDRPDAPRWWFAIFVFAHGSWGVPVFLMLSGALLLDPSRTEPTADFYRRRWRRIGPPLVFWSAFYLLWRATFKGETMTAAKAVEALLHAQPQFHLHYLFLIAGLYVITPLLRPYVRDSRPTEQLALAAFLVFSYDLACAVWTFVDRHPVEFTAFDRYLPFLGYYLAGPALRRLEPVPKTRLLVLAFLTATVAHATVTGAVFAGAAKPWDVAIGYTIYHDPTVAFMAASAFLLGRRLWPEEGVGPAVRLFAWLGPVSFGIYLLHPALLDIVRKVVPAPVLDNSAFLLVGTILVCAVAAGITEAGRRVPGLCRVFGE